MDVFCQTVIALTISKMSLLPLSILLTGLSVRNKSGVPQVITAQSKIFGCYLAVFCHFSYKK